MTDDPDTLRIDAVTAEFGTEHRIGPTPVLEVDSVTKIYPSEPPVEALRGVSFTVEAGELVGIVGPSGSGKTTLLHLMGTLDRPTTGAIRVAGFDAAQMSDRELSALRATRIGFVFQQFFLAEHESALDNVADGLLYAGVTLRERRERANEALAQVGLAHRGSALPPNSPAVNVSGWRSPEHSRASPAIVLADEPTGNLDSVNSQAILGLLEELNDGGATILVITHEREIAGRLPRQIEMLDGLIVADRVRAVPSRDADQPAAESQEHEHF